MAKEAVDKAGDFAPVGFAGARRSPHRIPSKSVGVLLENDLHNPRRETVAQIGRRPFEKRRVGDLAAAVVAQLPVPVDLRLGGKCCPAPAAAEMDRAFADDQAGWQADIGETAQAYLDDRLPAEGALAAADRLEPAGRQSRPPHRPGARSRSDGGQRSLP